MNASGQCSVSMPNLLTRVILFNAFISSALAAAVDIHVHVSLVHFLRKRSHACTCTWYLLATEQLLLLSGFDAFISKMRTVFDSCGKGKQGLGRILLRAASAYSVHDKISSTSNRNVMPGP